MNPVQNFNTGIYLIKNRFLFKLKLKNPPEQERLKVSLVIPTLCRGAQADHFQKLRRLLAEYLPRQTYQNYEALVCCDGPNPQVEAMAASLSDPRIKVMATEISTQKWGHPQTRLGIEKASGDFFVRMNDDNHPYRDYLQTLLSGFEPEIGIVYGRVLFQEPSRSRYCRKKKSFLIPDGAAAPRFGNIDCMNYAVRMGLAKKFLSAWTDNHAADWDFLDALLRAGVKTRFIETLLGEKF